MQTFAPGVPILKYISNGILSFRQIIYFFRRLDIGMKEITIFAFVLVGVVLVGGFIGCEWMPQIVQPNAPLLMEYSAFYAIYVCPENVTLFTELFFPNRESRPRNTQESHVPTGLPAENPHKNPDLKML